MLIQALCRGTDSIMFNPPPAKLGGPKMAEKSDEDLAREKIYTDDGQLYEPGKNKAGFPSRLLLRTLIEAGKFHKKGRKAITGAKSTEVTSFLRIRERFIPFFQGATWEVDVQNSKNDKEQLIRTVRPRFSDWGFVTTLIVKETKVSEELILALLKTAGEDVGIGSYNIRRGGECGAFEIVEFKVAKETGEKKEAIKIERVSEADLIQA